MKNFLDFLKFYGNVPDFLISYPKNLVNWKCPGFLKVSEIISLFCFIMLQFSPLFLLATISLAINSFISH